MKYQCDHEAQDAHDRSCEEVRQPVVERERSRVPRDRTEEPDPEPGAQRALEERGVDPPHPREERALDEDDRDRDQSCKREQHQRFSISFSLSSFA